MTLHISETLELHLEWMLLGTIIYGMPETGKSVLARVVAEEGAKAGVRFCIHDIKGDHYGLKSSPDGRKEGLPVVVFGGDHADLPLNIRAGTAMGEFVSNFDQSCIIDYEHFAEAEYLNFVADFSDSLYHHNRRNPIVSIYDEAQQLAPQTPDGTREARKCLSAVKKFSRLGRKHACGRIFLAQRGADVHKGVSELCETLISFRAPGTLDQERIKKWLGSKLPKERVQELVSGLNDLPTGTALFASAHPKVNVFGFHKVRRPDTFDSSATPALGKTRAEPIRLAKPALEKIAKQLASTIEEAQGDDPVALRAALAEEKRLRLKAEEERDVARLSVPSSAQVVVHETEVPIWDPEAFQALLGDIRDHERLCFGNISGALHVYKSKCMESNGAKYGLGGTPRERKTEPQMLLLAPESHVIGDGGFIRAAKSAVNTRSIRHNPKDWTQMEEDLYQKFKARLIEEGASDPKLLKVLTQVTELEVSQERVLVEVGGKSLKGRVAKLAADGFFADCRLNNHVKKELDRTGPGTSSSDISKCLAWLVEIGILTRESDGFRLATGAKVRLRDR